MRTAYREASADTSSAELVEIVTPRTNSAGIAAAENLFAAVPLAEPFALELAATASARWFLARAQSPEMHRFLTAQLAVAYPQATLRPLDTRQYPSIDPARLAQDEQVAACTLLLRAPVYLPIRTFIDRGDDDASTQADPVLGILGALDDLPDGWRALSQLVLRPAPDNWAAPYARLALEHPLEAERQTRSAPSSATTSDPGVLFLAAVLVVGAIGLQGYAWYTAGDVLDLALLVGGILGLGGVAAWLLTRRTSPPLYDPRLVAEKIGRPAHRAELRLAVFAPAEVALARVGLRLDRIVAAYRQYALASANGFQSRRLDLKDRHLADLRPFHRLGALPILSSRELAGLWHLSRAQADVPFVERTTARERLPLPSTVASGCRIGVSTHQSREVSVSIPDDVLRRHLLLVAKTRRGKSSLLLRFARYLMERRPGDGTRRAIVLVDPHRDLAQAPLGLIPPERQADVTYLDVSSTQRPFGLNLLDVGLGWDRDKAIENALAVFKREFAGFWGPRMEDAFRFGLLTLFEVNIALGQASPEGRARQYTILDLPSLLSDLAFRRTLLPLVTDPVVKSWWTTYFDALDRRLQIEVINPVQTKVQRFAGSAAARNIVGQAGSTIDPRTWIREGKIVIINTAKGTVGEDTAALLGGTLINLAALAIAEQSALDPAQRRPVSLLVDEFHANPGANYEAILAELSKYGANLVLATQSLARLEALDREHHRALRATVFANLDGLFAFHCSAEDARYLVHELGEGIDEHDLVSLGEHRCYARVSAAEGRPAAFSVRLDPPPASDPLLASHLAGESAQLYGRDRHAVARDLQLAIERIEQCRRRQLIALEPGQDGHGIPRDGVPPSGKSSKGKGKGRARNDKRDQTNHRDSPHQASYLADNNGATSNNPPPLAPTEPEDVPPLDPEPGEEEPS